jgi:hypothetical protein
MYIGIHVKYPLFLSEFNEIEFYQQIFLKYLRIKSHENSSTGNRILLCGQAGGRTDRETEMLIQHNFSP